MNNFENEKLLVYLPHKGKDGNIYRRAEADGEITFDVFLKGMNDKVRETIDLLRSLPYHSDEYNKVKSSLPFVWTGGYSESKLRRKSDITEIYNIITIDIDYADNKEVFDRNGIEVLKDELSNIPYVYYAGLSAGGYGIVLYILTENLTLENEPYVFNFFYERFKQTNIIIDSGAKDLITRFRNVSYDKHAIYNKNCKRFDCNTVSVDDVDTVKHSKSAKIITSNFYEDGDNDEKILVNRDLKIDIYNGTISGNEIRYRLSRIAEYLFGDNAKEWCGRHFYKIENGQIQNIYTKQNSKYETVNSYLLRWLEQKNIIKKKQEGILIKDGEYLSDRIDEIKKFVDEHSKSLIVAPTGTGKTTLINGLDGLADIYDAVVITPYNNTNLLYDRCTLVDSNRKPNFRYNKNNELVGKYVMNVDQAVKNWGVIREKNIIIDECHTLFSERMFRDKMIQICNLLKNDLRKKLILVSATPTGECDVLEVKDMIKFYTNRETIDVLFKYATNVNANGERHDTKKSFVNPICWTIKNHYSKKIFDRIVLMDDISAKDVYDALVLKYNIPADDILYYRADTKENYDCLQLVKEEKLMKKITICTRIAFNGLNFKNENENVLVITSFTPGSLLSANIIQMVGRVRKSNVTCLCYYNNAEFKESIIDLEDKLLIKNEQEKYPLIEYLYKVNEKYGDKEWVEIVRSIDKFYLDNSADVNKLCEGLVNTNYIRCKIYDDVLESYRIPNYRKQMEKEIIKKYIKDNKKNWNMMLNMETFNDYFYINDWVQDYKILVSKFSENENTINNLLLERLAMTNSSFENIINDIKLYCNVCSICDEEYEDLIIAYGKIISAVEINIKNKDYVTKLNNKVEKIRELRRKLKDAFDMNEVLYSELEEAEKAVEEKRQKSIEGGKMGKKIIVTKDMPKYELKEGDKFESCSALAEQINKSKKTISQWMSKGLIKSI